VQDAAQELTALVTRALEQTELARPRPGAAAAGPSADPAHPLVRVLVVEDNAVNQQVTRRFLERLGCEVELADNGQRALEFCSNGSYDLILMDVQMPVMDGLAATREIRRHEQSGRRTPIIALTAKAMKGDREKCLEAGASDYLAKPVNTDQLLSALRMWLHR